MEDVAIRHAGGLLRRAALRTALDGLAADAFQVQSGAVVGDFDVDLAALVEGTQSETTAGRFSGSRPRFGGLDAMIDGIAHEVRQRILNRFENRAVQFRVLTLHFQSNLLAAAQGQVPHSSRKFVPDIANRLHPGLHDLFLKFTGDPVQALGDDMKAGVFLVAGKLQQLVAGQYQFADKVHQLVEKIDADAHGLDSRFAPAHLENLLRGEDIFLFAEMKSHENFADAALIAVLLLGQGESQIFRTDAAAFDEDASELAGRGTVLAPMRFQTEVG